MSSPSQRRQQASQSTPRRSARNSQAPQSSPANANPASQTANTPSRPTRSSNLASSPLFYQSSPANGNAEVSSPLGHNTETQSNAGGSAAPSSPLRHMTHSQTTQNESQNDGDRTPRARGSGLVGESSPIRYEASSSPAPGLNLQSDLRSESSNLFVDGFQTPRARRTVRGDIHSEGLHMSSSRGNRIALDSTGRVVREVPSDTASFSNIDPNTSEANILGGRGETTIWGTNVSVDDAYAGLKDFMKNFTKKYRMWTEGMTKEATDADPDSETKPYLEDLKNMLALGGKILYIDIGDFKVYPRTRKLWHHIQSYPQELIPLMDQCCQDVMIELAQAEDARQRTQSNAVSASRPSGAPSSDMQFPSSERSEEQVSTPRPQEQQGPTLEDQVLSSIYTVRPFGLEKVTNMRDLNPSDMDKLICIKGLVIRTTPVIPDMKEAFFRCSVCNHSVLVELDRGRIREPTACPRPPL
ncbi:MCM2/3/5 family protein [Apiospora arundinis]